MFLLTHLCSNLSYTVINIFSIVLVGRGRGGSSGAPANFGGNFGGGGSDRGGIRDTGHNIHLRGLPFRAVERDIFEVIAIFEGIFAFSSRKFIYSCVCNECAFICNIALIGIIFYILFIL